MHAVFIVGVKKYLSTIKFFLLTTCLAFTTAAHSQVSESKSFNFDFSEGSQKWSFDFADYPQGSEEDLGLFYEFAPLPHYLNKGLNDNKKRFAVLLGGKNTSDDLFSFMRRQISGLKPLKRYMAFFTVTIASNAPAGAVGVGGAPGEAVYFKAGASSTKPEPFQYGNRMMNVDKGNQASGGKNALVLGDISVPAAASNQKTPYQLKTLTSSKPLVFTTDSNGKAWVFVGTDSGFEGVTELFYTSIKIRVEPDQEVKAQRY